MSDETPEQKSPETPSYDPTGIELALKISREVAGVLPPPRGIVEKKPRRRKQTGVQYSGSATDPRDPQPLGQAVDKLVQRQGWQTQLGVRTMLENWPQLVGSAIADHCKPVGFEAGVLQVRAESTTWATALRTLAPNVVAALNQQLGDGSVLRIDIKGPAAPSWRHGPRTVRDGRGPRDTYG